METETPLVDAVVATPVVAPICALGYYCSEELYNRGVLDGWEKMWICQVCKDGEIETAKNKPMCDRLSLLHRIETIEKNNYKVMMGVDKYSRIFGRTELIELKDFKVNMEVPIIPLNCLCGCFHKDDFTLDKQNERFEKTGKYKCFFNAKHIPTFKRHHK